MQIVIDIPNEIKKQIDEGKAIELNIPLWLAYSIHIGTPLPKGHGRLIDADKIKIRRLPDSPIVEYVEQIIQPIREYIEEQPTVIEAYPGQQN